MSGFTTCEADVSFAHGGLLRHYLPSKGGATSPLRAELPEEGKEVIFPCIERALHSAAAAN